jgi:hypothetical protein
MGYIRRKYDMVDDMAFTQGIYRKKWCRKYLHVMN